MKWKKEVIKGGERGGRRRGKKEEEKKVQMLGSKFL